jgi:HAD superfamily hydrolase (TIGR01509 family)
MPLKALIFDVDGTLANTEQDCHLRAFNEAFKLLNMNWHWDNVIYSDLLQVSGGKERIAHYMNQYEPLVETPLSKVDIARIHQLKTDIFVGYVAQGCVSIRTGVQRLVNEAILVGGGMSSKFEVIGAGDVVKNKKPASDIYQYVLDELKLSASECIVFEDSAVGFASASAIGLKTVVTLSEYTKAFEFDGAMVVIDHLGEKGKPFEIMSGRPSSHSFVNVEYLKELHEQNR